MIPTLVDRSSRLVGPSGYPHDDQPHREWIYRQAFHMARHIIGYECNRCWAAVDWFEGTRGGQGGSG